MHYILFFLFILSSCVNKPFQEKPDSLIIYLHGVSNNPKKDDQKLHRKLKNIAFKNTFVLYTPFAQGPCSYLSPPRFDQKCWDLLNFTDLNKIKQGVKRLEDQYGKFKRKIIIGYSNGGYFLAGALQRGMLNGFERIGILNGGTVGKYFHKQENNVPLIFIEIASEDESNKKQGDSLVKLLNKNVNSRKIFYRIIDRGHEIDSTSLESFVNWMLTQNKNISNDHKTNP